MPKFTYPMIFMFLESTGTYNGYLPDLAIFTEGKTLEDVYADAEFLLQRFMELSIKYNTEIPSPSTLDAVSQKWVGYKVSLISANVK